MCKNFYQSSATELEKNVVTWVLAYTFAFCTHAIFCRNGKKSTIGIIILQKKDSAVKRARDIFLNNNNLKNMVAYDCAFLMYVPFLINLEIVHLIQHKITPHPFCSKPFTTLVV